jgi:hypothetical protein
MSAYLAGLESDFYKRIEYNSKDKVSVVAINTFVTDKETCCKCGNSVKMGSGNFVNRIPDLNEPDDRIENGDVFPFGEYICEECDEFFNAIVESL